GATGGGGRGGGGRAGGCVHCTELYETVASRDDIHIFAELGGPGPAIAVRQARPAPCAMGPARPAPCAVGPGRPAPCAVGPGRSGSRGVRTVSPASRPSRAARGSYRWRGPDWAL